MTTGDGKFGGNPGPAITVTIVTTSFTYNGEEKRKEGGMNV
jgi:hypothetical protein